MTARLADYIREHGADVPGFNYVAAVEQQTCEGSKHHNPQPLMVRTYDLTRRSDNRPCSPAPSSKKRAKAPVRLCAVCYDNLTVYLAMLHSRGSSTGLRRDFGNSICAMGDRAWSYWQGQG